MIKRKARRRTAKLTAWQEPASQAGYGYEMPPEQILVEIYFGEKGFAQEAENFYAYFNERNWCCPKGTPYRNWKVLASDWLFDHAQFLKMQRRQRAAHSKFLKD